MLDFTLTKYRELLEALVGAGYRLISFEQYLQTLPTASPIVPSNARISTAMPIVPSIARISTASPIVPSNARIRTCQPTDRFVILRHDIDKRALQALLVGQIEREAGACASYYFRVVSESNRPDVIRRIAGMGFEVGYHYEDMSLTGGDPAKAKRHFSDWLSYFRRYYPVRTVCMHGAPQSGYDSKDLWKYCDYHDFGIIGEPYFDTDFSRVVYLTDTGRRWDGYRVSVRDKIPQYQEQWNKQGFVYHTTDDIIRAAKAGTLPERIMMTTHPQRWTDNPALWCYELLRQTLANIVKRLMISQKSQ